jgi:methyl-accepting chemotaxis protein
MSWFRNLKMMKKLMLGFTLVALALPLLGYMGLRNMGHINHDLTDLYNHDVLGMSYILDVQKHTRVIGRAVTAAIGASDRNEMEKQAQIFNTKQADLQKSLGQIKTTLVGDEEKKAFTEAEKAFGESLKVYNEALQLALVDKDKEAQANSSKSRAFRDKADELVDQLVVAKLKAAEAGKKNADATYHGSRNVIIGVIFAAVILAVGLGYLIAATTTGSLNHAVETMNVAAGGDLTRRMNVSSQDEIGTMGLALNGFLAALEKSLSSIANNANGLAISAEELSSVSRQMAGNAEETSTQVNMVSAASEQVSKNVHTVATGTEEMGASIREIAKNATDAAKVAGNAVQVAAKTNATVSKLGDSSAEIGQVIKVINSIAEQTNLLALNATIEAARAGEAGKGFAVVANEVKELAKQTGKATEDISQKIQSIQVSTQEAVEAIESIGKVINQISDISNTIASAVEEQSATTSEISRNVAEAAKGVSEISQNVVGVSETAKSTSSGASEAQTAAQELARMAADLQSLVGQFKYSDGGEKEQGGRRYYEEKTSAANSNKPMRNQQRYRSTAVTKRSLEIARTL